MLGLSLLLAGLEVTAWLAGLGLELAGLELAGLELAGLELVGLRLLLVGLEVVFNI